VMPRSTAPSNVKRRCVIATNAYPVPVKCAATPKTHYLGSGSVW
jgi:hypothetical protein